MTKSKQEKTNCQLAIEMALKVGSPLTMPEIADAIGMHYDTVRRKLRQMCKPMGNEAYVCGWREEDGKHSVQLFALGDKPDVAKPVRKRKGAECIERRRIMKQQNEDSAFEVQLELERARKARKALSTPAFRHPLDVIFFGEYRRIAA